mmetsp:Transcript_116093/g.328526  ORF Transcript_116093/g.328526 Transcript_116093/m.328526 type:complete len:137 (-) Transcript_116093:17-427(-)
MALPRPVSLGNAQPVRPRDPDLPSARRAVRVALRRLPATRTAAEYTSAKAAAAPTKLNVEPCDEVSWTGAAAAPTPAAPSWNVGWPGRPNCGTKAVNHFVDAAKAAILAAADAMRLVRGGGGCEARATKWRRKKMN